MAEVNPRDPRRQTDTRPARVRAEICRDTCTCVLGRFPRVEDPLVEVFLLAMLRAQHVFHVKYQGTRHTRHIL